MKLKSLCLPVTLVLVILFSACGKKQQAKTNDKVTEIALFNGKNLDGWGFILQDDSLSADQVFSVRDSVIHILGAPFGYMYTKEKYDNFKLHVEWRYPKEATNSGIFLFVQDDLIVWPNAIECQLCAEKAGDFVLLGGSDMAEFQLGPDEERPAFPMIEKKEPSSEHPTGEWNTADITTENGEISVYINGVYQNHGTITQSKSGHIALQSEGKEIQFRNMKLIKL